MRSSDDIDFQRALASPSSVFESPEAVLVDPRLDTEAKRAILSSWERDARELMVAQDEAMTGGEPSMFDRVRAALGRLSDIGREAAAPTQHGGGTAPVRTISELVRPLYEVLHPDHDLDEASGRLRSSGLAALAVVDGDEVVGIVDEAMLAAAPREPSPATGQAPTVRDVMTTEIAFCFHDDDPERVAALVARHGALAVLVLDPNRELAGIVLAGDLMAPADAAGRQSTRERVARSAGRAREDRPGRLRSYSVRPRVDTPEAEEPRRTRRARPRNGPKSR
jgi:CBS domain-containing protein